MAAPPSTSKYIVGPKRLVCWLCAARCLLHLMPQLLLLLHFRLDCGTGPGIVRTSETVRLHRWNTLTVFRHDWGVWIDLNEGRHEEGRSQVGCYSDKRLQ